jgi:hypothetical protein
MNGVVKRRKLLKHEWHVRLHPLYDRHGTHVEEVVRELEEYGYTVDHVDPMPLYQPEAMPHFAVVAKRVKGDDDGVSDE